MSQNIVSVRIHIERVIGYTILLGILPLRLLKSIKDEAASVTFPNCDKIVTALAPLTNIGESILYN